MNKDLAKISDKNRRRARKILFGDAGAGLTLHHKDPSWKKEDPERYAQWNLDDLVVMTTGYHQHWHMLHSNPNDYCDKSYHQDPEYRKKIGSKGDKNPARTHRETNYFVANNPMHDPEIRQRHREACKNAHKKESMEVYDTVSGVVYPSIRDASIALNLSRYKIQNSERFTVSNKGGFHRDKTSVE